MCVAKNFCCPHITYSDFSLFSAVVKSISVFCILYSFVSPFADKLIFISGVFSYLSYRDPNLLKTLEVYDGTEDFLRELEMDDNTLTKAIIGTIGDVDSYQLPDAKGYSRYETSS